MKTNYIKCGIWLVAAVFTAVSAKAQTGATGKTAYDAGRYDNYDRIRNEDGKHVERIQSDMDDKVYRLELANGKMTELYVDGVKIPAADWDKYSDAIAAIREQIRKNKIQAARNEEQAKLNAIQEKKNEEQAVRNEEQARLNELQVKKNQVQEERNEEQVKLNQVQAARNKEQAKKNQLQAEKKPRSGRRK